MFGSQNKPTGLFGQSTGTTGATGTTGTTGTTGASTGFSLGGSNAGSSTTSSLFGAKPAGQQPPAAQSAPVAGQVPPPSVPVKLSALSADGTPTNKLLKDLIGLANNLPKPLNQALGLLHLTLGELQRQLKRDADEANYTKAHYLLAPSGMNAERIENELALIEQWQKQSQPAKMTVAVSHSQALQKDENILLTIEDLLSQASHDFDLFISSNILIDWKQRRDQLRQLIDLVQVDANNADATSKPIVAWNQTMPGAYAMLSPLNPESAPLLRTMLRSKFESHAQVVYELNEARESKQAFPMATRIGELNKVENDMKSKQMVDAWNILQLLVGEPAKKTSQEQAFYQSYQGSQPQKFHNLVIRNSCQSLETEFWHYIEEVYVKDSNRPPQFQLGLDVVKVKYAIHKILQTMEPEVLDHTLVVNGVPVWALIFYMMRAGLYEEALGVINEYGSLFQKFDTNFPVYFAKFVQSDTHTLPSEISKKIHQEFAQQFQFVLDDVDSAVMSPGFDPYKYAVYKIVGKCDMGNRTLPHALNLLIEDWLWFHLLLITQGLPSDSTLVFDNYTLTNLQQTVVGFGPVKFLTLSNNSLYLKALVLVGLYELAVQYAYDHINECDAVHLAIGLNYYGLLRVATVLASSPNQLLIHTKNHQAINFARLMGSFTRTFKISDPKVASQYLILVAMSHGNDEITKAHEGLRELILVSREFSMLLGQLDASGRKTPGLLSRQRLLIHLDDVNEFDHVILGISANQCMEQGRIFDALLLYQLADEFDTAVLIVNKLVSEILALTELDLPVVKYGNYARTLTTDNTPDTIDNNIILLAHHLQGVYKANGDILAKLSSQNRDTNTGLLKIIDIRNSFVDKKWHQVLAGIKDLGIIPIATNDDLQSIRKEAALVQSDGMDDQLKRVIPLLLIMTMTLVSQLNYNVLTKGYPGGDDGEEMRRLRQTAKHCMLYAGMVQYKMPRETYSMLVNLESSL